MVENSRDRIDHISVGGSMLNVLDVQFHAQMSRQRVGLEGGRTGSDWAVIDRSQR